MSRRTAQRVIVTRAVELAIALHEWVWSDARLVRLESMLGGLGERSGLEHLLSLPRVGPGLAGDFDVCLRVALDLPEVAEWISSPERLARFEMLVGARLAGGPVRNFVTKADVDVFVAAVGADVWETCLAETSGASVAGAGADPLRVARSLATEGRVAVAACVHAAQPALALAIADSGLVGWEGVPFGAPAREDLIATVNAVARARRP